jgi:hypothetical protein
MLQVGAGKKKSFAMAISLALLLGVLAALWERQQQ